MGKKLRQPAFVRHHVPARTPVFTLCSATIVWRFVASAHEQVVPRQHVHLLYAAADRTGAPRGTGHYHLGLKLLHAAL